MSKVLIITESLTNAIGGPFWSVKATVAILLSKGHDVLLYGSRDRFADPLLPEHYLDLKNEYKNLKVFALKKIGPQNLHLTPTILCRLLFTKRVDAILLQGPWTWNCWVAFVWGKFKQIPVYMSIRGEFVDTKSVRKIKKRFFLPWVFYMMRNLKGIHVLNKHEVAAIRSYNINTNCVVIPNGVYLNKKIQAVKRDNFFLYLGRLHPDKNILNLISAWKRIVLNEDWRLIIAGSGKTRFERQIKEAVNGSDSIEVIGPVVGSRKEDLFLSASWFILPSLMEGMPVAALEAIGYGLPVICSKECNLDEFVSLRAVISTGLDVDSIKETIERAIFLENKERDDMIRVGYELVYRKYTWDKVGDSLIDFLNL
jgi:poly(glycerol-phosphate) alpha-glucosyltransferase